jgi:hypothetical protein
VHAEAFGNLPELDEGLTCDTDFAASDHHTSSPNR